MTRINGRIGGHIPIPSNPDAQVLLHCQINGASKSVTTQSREQVRSAGFIAIEKIPLFPAEDHHVGKDPSLRCEQCPRAAGALRNLLDIRCHERLQKVRRLIAKDADHPARNISSYTGQVRHGRPYFLSSTLPV